MPKAPTKAEVEAAMTPTKVEEPNYKEQIKEADNQARSKIEDLMHEARIEALVTGSSPFTLQEKPQYPKNWLPESDPNLDMMDLKGKDYLVIQKRILWFIRDQRDMIASGLARYPYTIGEVKYREIDTVNKCAYFEVVVMDVLGNEYYGEGSETASDFKDYIEKAKTKAVGRALMFGGYTTGRAQELDEGERIADAPQARPKPTNSPTSEQMALVKKYFPGIPQDKLDTMSKEQAENRIKVYEESQKEKAA